MKKTIKILIPILLAIAIVLCSAWYLFVYDRAFTRDMLLTFARQNEDVGNHSIAAWFYNQAYSQSADNDEVAIELAEQYKGIGNYTKAEYTLSNAIADGGGIELYIALSKTYVEQDKVLDAVNMLNNITNTEIKHNIDLLRPSAPTITPDPGYYNQYISVTVNAESGTIYASTTDKYPSVTKDLYQEPIQLSDGENTIYTVAISENGLVSPLAIYGYTVGGVIELVEFNDPVIETEIRKILGVSAEAEVYTNDLWTIKTFTVPAGASNYAVLKHMSFLEELTIENGVQSQLSNISSLANLTQLIITNNSLNQEEIKSIGSLPSLKKLILQNCRITSVAGLENASSLIYLDLSNNTIRDISALSNMTDLQELYLQSNVVVDLSSISNCKALTKLDVSSNALTSLSPISGLTALTWLNASTNVITDLGEIGKLTALTSLQLAQNGLTEISAISSCTNITDLNISSNQITDISSLSSLVNMLYFDFAYNQVKEIPAFPKNCALVNIDGSNNQISSLKPLGGLKNLNGVNMDYNTEISSVDPLADCPVLIEVNVYETKVKDVTKLTNQSIIVNYKPV